MNFKLESRTTKPAAAAHLEVPAGDELMFGCECALPFLTGVPRAAPGRSALLSLALGTMGALAACNAAPDSALQQEPLDKVSAAFAKVDREIARAKDRLNWSQQSQPLADAESPSER